ncbi:MAG: hypothetical protein ACJ72Z_04555 [Pyrinomonadaceae bacterium]
MFTSCFSSFAFGLAMLTSVVAAVLWVLSKTSDAWLTNWVPVTLILAFAFFVSGAHCLDVSERRDRNDWS